MAIRIKTSRGSSVTAERLSRNQVAGRTPVPMDPAQLEALSAAFCSQNEIAAYFGASRSSLTRRLRDSREHREAYERGCARAIVTLRRRQIDVALGREAVHDADGKLVTPGRPPNARMLVWLGKQYLGQSDRLTATIDPLQRGGEVMADDEVVVRWDADMEGDYQALEDDIIDADFEVVGGRGAG